MVKILDFNCVRNFWQRVMVYMISLIYTCLDFHWKFFSHKPLFISSTIFLPIVTLWQPLKNKNLISLNWEKLLYNISDNLFSLTSKILGSYMWAFTVIQIPEARKSLLVESRILGLWIWNLISSRNPETSYEIWNPSSIE